MKIKWGKKLIFSIFLIFFVIFVSCEQKVMQERIKPVNTGEVKLDTFKTLRVAVGAMVSPKSTYEYYNELIAYLSQKLGYKYKFIQRKTYKQVNDLIQKNEVDIAFICSGAYKIASKSFDPPIICVPQMYGEPYYQSILISPKNSKYNSIDSLKDAIICYTDSLSNSGYMYINNYFKLKKIDPDTLFSKQIFTGGHDISIGMVQKNLVDVAPIDKLIYDYLAIEKPNLVSNIKIIHYSPKFGIPPIVASKKLDSNLFKRIQEILLNMHNNDTGRKILAKIHIDKFILGDKKNYENVPIFFK